VAKGKGNKLVGALKGMLGGAKEGATRVGAGEVLQEGLLGTSVGFAKKNPGLGILGAGLTLPWVGGMAKDLGEAGYSHLTREDVKLQRMKQILAQEERSRNLAHRLNMDSMRQAMLRSAARLAQMDPQLYNEVLSGRRLPQGAMVFGGRPRVDLMEQLAMDMAMGGFTQPKDPQAELLGMLGA
jgi:hypothetical protein